ncbi:MAG TPA: helix-turn-helix transcriptional regulator [Vicinamibacterales bacterium]|nr:helix-turn-helix transcriptional regulator [Vicinamibacterales bacterium]
MKTDRTLTAKWAVQVYLLNKGWTQVDLARRAHIDATALSMVLSGRRAPTPTFVRRLRQITGIDLNDYRQSRVEFFGPVGTRRPKADEELVAQPA